MFQRFYIDIDNLKYFDFDEGLSYIDSLMTSHIFPSMIDNECEDFIHLLAIF